MGKEARLFVKFPKRGAAMTSERNRQASGAVGVGGRQKIRNCHKVNLVKARKFTKVVRTHNRVEAEMSSEAIFKGLKDMDWPASKSK